MTDYENQQQKIHRLEGIHGPCRENFMNDEAYLKKLEGLAVEPEPKPKPKMSSFFKRGAKKK